MKQCNICGIPKSKTFKCSRCDSRICVSCYIFAVGLCVNCTVMDFNEKYKDRIEKYENNVTREELKDMVIAG